jgi:N-acetylglutamate synthase-like GNAT family acetyltransferase
MKIRPYTPEDKHIMKKIFQTYAPEFFDPGEWNDYEIYLDRNQDHYYVAEHEGKVVGGGGYRITKGGRVGRVSWNIILPEHTNHGIGKELVHLAINDLKEIGVDKIEVWTSNKSFKYYEKFGFKTFDHKPNYWGKGLDLYRMNLQE